VDGSELFVVVAAIAAGGMVKSISGMGLPVVAVPLISLVVPLEQAVVCAALPGLIVNAVITVQERAHRGETRDLPVLAVTGVVGGALGALLLVHLPEAPVLATLAVLVLAYIALALSRPELRLDPATTTRWSPPVGLAAGVMQGATGISGPVTGTWIHAYRLPRDAHVFAVTTLFLVSGVGQVVPLLVGGSFDGRWAGALVGIPVALAAIPFGARIRSRLSGRAFDRSVLAALALSAVTIIVRLAI
jgi:uncharacterized membrane protein YfcA